MGPGGKLSYLALRPALFPHLQASHLDSALQVLHLKLLTGPTPLTDSCELSPDSSPFSPSPSWPP